MQIGNELVNILISGGGTGGHFFPAYSLMEHLKTKKYKVTLTTDERCKKYFLKEHYKDEIEVLEVARLGFSPKKFICFIFSLIGNIVTNIKLIKRNNIMIVVTFGGYTSVAAIIAAIILRKKIILNEQNVIAGRTNKFFAFFATKIASGFKSVKGFEKYKNKLVITGIPVRDSFSKIIKQDKNKQFRILVMGGSQAAEIFSDIIPKILSYLDPKDIKVIKLMQQSRRDKINQLENELISLGVNFHIDEFFYNSSEEIQRANLIITRSGASTIAEIIALRKPAIFIPYPYAKDNHQYYNAKELEQIGVAKLFSQKNVNYRNLAEYITEIMHNVNHESEIRAIYRKNYKESPGENLEKVIRNIINY